MRITEDTSLDDLWKLRREFAPRWSRESAKLREARGALSGAELRKAEQEYMDFETVATSVIAITDLRQAYHKALEDLASANAALSDASMSSPGKPMEDLKLKDLQADGTQARYLREREAGMASLRECEAAVAEKDRGGYALHVLEHAVADAGIRLSWAESCRSVLTDVMVGEFREDKRALRHAMEAMNDGNRDSAAEHLRHRLGKAFG